MHKVRLTTDGICVGNPGPGGWACLLRCGGHKRVLCGGEKKTTNNRMELVAGTGPQDPLALGSRSRARCGPAAV
jgi:ribonuclease HI